jgi:glycosyltransferase involved in cell wall biosynthesis
MSRRIWITWEIQRRNRSMSKMLDASLHELILDGPVWRRYPVLIIKTIGLVWRTSPEIVFVQNPSMILAGLSVLISRLFNVRVIIDAHNAGLFPMEGQYKILNKVARFINKKALLVIVSNDSLVPHVENNGGKAFAIPDPVPAISCFKKTRLTTDKFNILFVCSWSDDEPYVEVLHAANMINQPVRIFITGNSKGRHLKYSADLLKNVILTGFLSNEDYDALLCSCDAVMVLTTREDCLVCGAYEGVAVGKPLILSGTNSLRTFFNKGCIYTNNTRQEIALAMSGAISKNALLSKEVRELKIDLALNMDNTMRAFQQRLLKVLKH